YIYISFFIIIILSFVYFSKTVIADVDTSIPAVPDNFTGLDLRENFHDVVNTGGGFSYSQDNSILQMTNWYNQKTAIWGKNQVDLSQYFKVEFYFYMGNSGKDAGDGMIFGLQNYSPSYIGDAGSGMGFYSDREAYKVAVEFDTYFNADSKRGDAPDSWYGPHGDNGLKSRANHMAVATSDKNWKNYQYHYSASSIGTNTFFSNGAWKKVVIEGKPIAGKATQTMLSYSMYDLSYGTTIYGQCMVDFNSNMNDYSSHHFLRSKYAYWGFTSSTGEKKEIAAMSFGTLPQTATLTTKDVTIYAGQDWNPSMNFISGMDEKAQLFGYDDSRLTQENNVDTSKPGTYMVNYYYKNGNFDAHSEVNV
ncbi:bacterial Ig-like domain-containing protein, partial [Enterococcus faecalis]|nr:bacterial Ig-like domain-containing protein [Enterococcus faecalis]